MFTATKWTQEELDRILPKLEKEVIKIQEEELEDGNTIKPLGPMTKNEAMDYFNRITDTALTRPLTRQETFLHGQLLSVYEMAILAETLGKKGRYFVLSEDKLDQLIGASKNG